MDYRGKIKVCERVPMQKCKDMTGNAHQSQLGRHQQAGRCDPKYRRRLVAKNFKRWADPATLPIDVLRFIVSVAATRVSRFGKKRMVNDVARACFNASSLTPTFLDVCDQDWEPRDEGMCCELRVPMSGTRPAALNRHTSFE